MALWHQKRPWPRTKKLKNQIDSCVSIFHTNSVQKHLSELNNEITVLWRKILQLSASPMTAFSFQCRLPLQKELVSLKLWSKAEEGRKASRLSKTTVTCVKDAINDDVCSSCTTLNFNLTWFIDTQSILFPYSQEHPGVKCYHG